MPKIHFLIPAYNEAENLRFLLPNIRRFMHAFHYPYRILVVDDGSKDGTSDVVAEHREVHKIEAHAVRHEINQGPGGGFRTGFKEILKHAADDDRVVTIEADNTSDLCVLHRMIERCDRGADLVLASVYGVGRIVGAPRSRLILSAGSNALLKAAFHIKDLNTFSSFFRVHKVPMLREAFDLYGDDFISQRGFVCAVEMFIKLHHMGYHISEVPMLLDSKIRIGDSKMKVLRNIRDYVRVIAHHKLDPHALKTLPHPPHGR